MLPAHEKIDATIFDVDKNDSLARQVLHAYYRTPDASGAIYRTFPEFFLVKPHIFDDALLAFNKHERPLIESCKRLAELRPGLIGITQYFDNKFSYHWIKYSVYPFMLGEADTEYQDEFFYLLNQFVLFTQSNPNVYGDLTEDASSDTDVALMLAAIRLHASNMDKKLQYYSSTRLLSFDASWPSWQVKMLLTALELNQQSWNHLFLEHLRYVMRRNKGLVKASATPPLLKAVSALADTRVSFPHEPFSDDPTASKVLLGEPALHAEAPQFDFPVTMMGNAESFNSLSTEKHLSKDVTATTRVSEVLVIDEPSTNTVVSTSIGLNWREVQWVDGVIKKLGWLSLLLASALAGFLFAHIEQKKISQVDGGLIRPASTPMSRMDETNNNLIVLENFKMSGQLTAAEH